MFTIDIGICMFARAPVKAHHTITPELGSHITGKAGEHHFFDFDFLHSARIRQGQLFTIWKLKMN